MIIVSRIKHVKVDRRLNVTNKFKFQRRLSSRLPIVMFRGTPCTLILSGQLLITYPHTDRSVTYYISSYWQVSYLLPTLKLAGQLLINTLILAGQFFISYPHTSRSVTYYLPSY